ncbi:MAG: DUF4446 family protein [Candidatus Taylorbacteria bacterium]|nr:DUF4446 family protein [Candidatus Taylorbacteria bacterium]
MEPYIQEIIVGSAIVIAILITLVIHLEFRLNRLLRGKTGKDLEAVIAGNVSDIKRFKQFREEIERYLETVEQRLCQSVRGVGTVRFNPFKGKGEGGNQSFAASFLNEKGGVAISSLYSRDRVSVFAKPINNFKSAYELTKEEREAIEKARQTLRA